MNRRMPNGTSGGVGGRQGDPASYPITPCMNDILEVQVLFTS